MAKNNLSSLSIADLEALIRDAQDELDRKKVEARERLKARLQAEAEAEGFSINDLFSVASVSAPASLVRKAKGERGPVAPKYANPHNPAETWTGRGRQPKWVVAQIAEGNTLESFLIK